MGRKIEVRPGDKYGRLTVIKEVDRYVDSSGRKYRQMLCSCDCGSEPIKVLLNSLRKGHTKSCGCLSIEKAIENGKANKKYNKYDLSGEYGKGYTQKGEEFIFDLEDYNLIKDYRWSIGTDGYLYSYNSNTGKKISLHRLIMNPPKDMIVDHINRTPQDNRKSNLRICSFAENSRNLSISKRNNTGTIGVGWSNQKNKWLARIMINGKAMHLGYFDTKEEAIEARLKAELELYGTFSPNYEKLTQQQSSQPSEQQNT